MTELGPAPSPWSSEPLPMPGRGAKRTALPAVCVAKGGRCASRRSSTSTRTTPHEHGQQQQRHPVPDRRFWTGGQRGLFGGAVPEGTHGRGIADCFSFRRAQAPSLRSSLGNTQTKPHFFSTAMPPFFGRGAVQHRSARRQSLPVRCQHHAEHGAFDPEEPCPCSTFEMIDTVALKTSEPLGEGLLEDLKSNRQRDWTTRSEELILSWDGSKRKSARAYNRVQKQTAVIDGDGNLKRLECSAAGRLFGTNGMQLKTACDVHRARAALLQDCRYFVPGVQEEDLKIIRIDLALTLRTDPILMDLHRHATHPMVRREKESYYNAGKTVRTEEPMNRLRTVRFKGVTTVIQFYDKLAEVCQKNGRTPGERAHAVRVEVQLKGAKHIAKLFGMEERGFITLADLELETCYRVFRCILLRFENAAKIPKFQPNMASFAAILENHPETWRHLGGLEPLDWIRRSKGLSDKHFKALRREVSRQRLKLEPFYWADILPEDRLPDLVDIDHDGIATIVPSPPGFA